MDVDVSRGSAETLTVEQVRDFLRSQLHKEAVTQYGLDDVEWLDRVTNNWFNDHDNYDGRWATIRARMPAVGRVLDMAAGCGTFLAYGLHAGHDVWGIEPEAWKVEYFGKKVASSGYPSWYRSRLVRACGESLPFKAQTFDVVTTYQTLEHVDDVARCLAEFIRVLKPGGALYIKAPDYRAFFEPHYRVPMLPQMNKRFASWYLRMLGRPLAGLKSLNWTTEGEIIGLIRKHLGGRAQIERTNEAELFMRRKRFVERCSRWLPRSVLHGIFKARTVVNTSIDRIPKFGRQERHIDLWITKLA